MGECFSMGAHVVRARRENSMSSSVNDVFFFNGAFEARQKLSRWTERLYIFTLQCFSRISVGFEM